MDKVLTAYKEMKRLFDSGTWNDGDSLPSLNQLAESCHVSRMTMWRAIDRLRNESLLHTRGRLIICGKSSTLGKPKPAHVGFTWERLKNRIGQDIHAHAFAGTNLPPVNKLAIHYGSACNTLKKALEKLVSEGLLVHSGRRYAQTSNRAALYQPSAVFIGQGNSAYGVISLDQRTEQVIRSFERECQALHITARIEGFDVGTPTAVIDLCASIEKTRNITGFIINLWKPSTQAHWQQWLDLFEFLARQNIPIIIIDQEGDITFPSHFLRSVNIRVLRIAAIRAGTMMAEILLRCGYRHAAFLSHDLSAYWVRSRFQGFKKHFESFGGAGAVVEFYSLGDAPDLNDLTRAAMGLNSTQMKALFKAGYSREQLDALVHKMAAPEWAKLKAMLPENRNAAAVKAYAAFLAHPKRQGLDPRYYDALFQALWTIASTEAMEFGREILFKKVFASSSAEVWVTSDDQTAYSALAFLEKKGRKVPADIAVTGFDDWRESLGYGLTTYNFNMLGIVQQALRMIVDKSFLKSKPAICEVDGYVVERRTTRR
jgi:DNA-binding LacI/PurR family transcriptional regulator/DNA-binding transcriptional regulator YhcF (GntR family)